MFFSLCRVNSAKTDLLKKAIGNRIKKLREALNQTQRQVADMVGISVGTYRAIETGTTLSGEFLISLADYFGMTPSELINTELDVPDVTELRARMQSYHTEHLQKVLTVLNKPPELKWILERLLSSGFLDRPKRVRDIAEKIKEDYNVQYRSAAVSNALIKLTISGKVRREKQDIKNYLYSSAKPA